MIELDRVVDADGIAGMAGRNLRVGAEPTCSRVTPLRLDEHILHVIRDGVLTKTLPTALDSNSGQVLSTLPNRQTLARQQEMNHTDFLELSIS